MAERFTFHEESSGFVGQPPERVFAMLDDHERLAGHMAKPSWRMGWATMQIITDPQRPRGLGAPITLRGRVFGLRLSVDEVVTRYEPPSVKEWETTHEPRLLVLQRRIAELGRLDTVISGFMDIIWAFPVILRRVSSEALRPSPVGPTQAGGAPAERATTPPARWASTSPWSGSGSSSCRCCSRRWRSRCAG